MSDENDDRYSSEAISSIFAMILPVLAIVLLGAKNIGNGFDKNESTMWVLGLSLVLSILGIVCGANGRKDHFTKVATIAGVGTAMLAGLVFVAMK